MIGETANSARLAMSKTEMNPWEKRLTWNGVNIPRIARNGSAPTSLPVTRQWMTKVTAASDTMTQTVIL